jgi:hypothetical protein
MKIGTRTQDKRRADRALRRRREEAARGRDCAPPAEGEPAPERPQARERDAGGPQDKALYVCRCGSAFQAVVTASVRCPHCGEPQAW